MDPMQAIPFLSLPPELIARIFAFLHPEELVNLSNTCRAVRALELERMYPHKIWIWMEDWGEASPRPFKTFEKPHMSGWYNCMTETEYGYLKQATSIRVQFMFSREVRLDPKVLEALPGLTSLDFEGSDVTNEDLAAIAGLTNLRKLNLDKTWVSDAGMPHLAGLTGLTQLILSWTKVTNAGLPHLARLTNLTYLNFHLTKVTPAGLPHLATLTNLETLCISRCEDGEALRMLQALRQT